MDCVAEQLGAASVDELMLSTSRADAAVAGSQGVGFMVRWEEEPGSASKRESRRYVRALAGIDASGVRSRADKLVRAKPLASMAQAGSVKLVAGSWINEWLGHMHGQPDLPHDDIMDASSGAFNALTEAEEYGKPGTVRYA